MVNLIIEQVAKKLIQNTKWLQESRTQLRSKNKTSTVDSEKTEEKMQLEAARQTIRNADERQLTIRENETRSSGGKQPSDTEELQLLEEKYSDEKREKGEEIQDPKQCKLQCPEDDIQQFELDKLQFMESRHEEFLMQCRSTNLNTQNIQHQHQQQQQLAAEEHHQGKSCSSLV